MSKPLHKKYPFIVWWGKRLGSFAYYIDNQCQQAERDGAPRTATYKPTDHSKKPEEIEWETIHGITNERTIAELKQDFGEDVFDANPK